MKYYQVMLSIIRYILRGTGVNNIKRHILIGAKCLTYDWAKYQFISKLIGSTVEMNGFSSKSILMARFKCLINRQLV